MLSAAADTIPSAMWKFPDGFIAGIRKGFRRVAGRVSKRFPAGFPEGFRQGFWKVSKGFRGFPQAVSSKAGFESHGFSTKDDTGQGFPSACAYHYYNVRKANEATAVSVRALNSWVVFL